jgi:hypothetical protein
MLSVAGMLTLTGTNVRGDLTATASCFSLRRQRRNDSVLSPCPAQ